MARAGFGLFARGFRLAYGSAYRAFLADLAEPEGAQARLLGQLVADMTATDYGRRHGIAQDDGYRQFAQKLPIVDYDRLSPWIELQRRSLRPVLCPGGAAFYERTSGSSGASKEIPYTRGLQASFVRMFLLWAYDCLQHGPQLRSGATFLSVSPGSAQDDADYLPRWLHAVIGRHLVLPRGLRQVADAETFKRILAAYLLNEPALEVISVWNPSYFSSLLEFIEAKRSLLAADLRAGAIAAGGRVFRLPQPTSPQRIQSLDAGAPDFRELWPQLRLLSCWTDANASLVIEPLRRRLPHAVIQSKGLVATEAPMTIPLWRASAPVPLLSEVFFEFVADDGSIRRLHEVEVGARYGLVISQRGGLARYRIGDRVEVVGRYLAAPTLRFIGRSCVVSDLVGEKLNENFVRVSLEGLAQLARVRWMLLPVVERGKAGYLILLDGPLASGDVCAAVDARLQHAHHYRLARELGQLAPVVLERHERLDDAYLEWSGAQGRKWGNVKPCALIADVERAASFRRFIRTSRGQLHGSAA